MTIELLNSLLTSGNKISQFDELRKSLLHILNI